MWTLNWRKIKWTSSVLFSRKWCLFLVIMFRLTELQPWELSFCHFASVTQGLSASCLSHNSCTQLKFSLWSWSCYVHSLMFSYWLPSSFPGLLGQHQAQESSPFLPIRKTHQWQKFSAGGLHQPVLLVSQFNALLSPPRNQIFMSSSAPVLLRNDCHHKKDSCNFLA